MSPETYERFRRLVYAQSGINLGLNKMALVASRVGKRMRALGLSHFEDYLNWMQQDAHSDEITHFVDSISTNVTSFFREPHHFTYLQELIATWRQEHRQKVRIWSAACSSGEEPYSIAMTMHDGFQGCSIDWRVLATDISTRILQQAIRAEYGEEKVATITTPFKSRYCRRDTDEGGVHYTIQQDVRERVTFRQFNLSVAPYPLRGPLDVIFCRNVMIYFDNQVRKKLLGEFYRLLRPGGILFVGHAESLTGLTTDFKPLQVSIYTK